MDGVLDNLLEKLGITDSFSFIFYFKSKTNFIINLIILHIYFIINIYVFSINILCRYLLYLIFI